ncbi:MULTISPECIES: hypothetical protein [Amycolatopsis]|uniref:Uncharacterized protein n=2 Tax=Amycolatopsis TaxID=1813 RepID=A0A1I3K3V7_9PSEU|nr:hypothetical protein [Amycolatopsis sacchari]SFI67199.1 hypothetical protein SAMN05421835_101403 [Amycolatopsis sacchari]
MTDRTRLHWVPATAARCWLSLFAGVVLLGSSIWMLSTGDERLPVFSVVAAVAAALLVIIAVVGLVSPRLRGR